MYPLLLIKSFGKEKSSDIVSEILRTNNESVAEPMDVCIDSFTFKVQELSICTKYYKTNILLFECEDIYSIPKAVRNAIEGAIFYFDSNDMNFLSELNSLISFVKENNIDLSTLITRNLNEKYGLSYESLKNKFSNEVNIIDLNPNQDNDEPYGYEEVLEILKNNIWSSISVSNRNLNSDKLQDPNIEDALSEFEELLYKFQQFKEVSQNMSREEVLQNAENLAELFAKMLNED
ncbi:uncharacterized protein ACRADG_002162 isoform 2-T8 [Cochliomyia hominivorax]